MFLRILTTDTNSCATSCIDARSNGDGDGEDMNFMFERQEQYRVSAANE